MDNIFLIILHENATVLTTGYVNMHKDNNPSKIFPLQKHFLKDVFHHWAFFEIIFRKEI